MKHFVLVAVAALAVMQVPAKATAFGTLDIGVSSGGGVTVTATTITFTPSTGGIVTTAGTDVTFGASASSLLPGVTGNILSLTGVLPVDNFMTFTGATGLDFTLQGLGPGTTNTTCTGLSGGGSCSVITGSPFVLTSNGAGGSNVFLDAFGTVTDGTGVTSTWSGLFSQPISTLTPAQIQTEILTPGGSVSSPFSGDFTVTITPEPGTLSMLAIGLGFLGVFLYSNRSKRRSEQ
jgi:hypothetical protein